MAAPTTGGASSSSRPAAARSGGAATATTRQRTLTSRCVGGGGAGGGGRHASSPVPGQEQSPVQHGSLSCRKQTLRLRTVGSRPAPHAVPPPPPVHMLVSACRAGKAAPQAALPADSVPCCLSLCLCLQDWQKKHELDRKAIEELVCALCDTRQPVGTSCAACGVEFGACGRVARVWWQGCVGGCSLAARAVPHMHYGPPADVLQCECNPAAGPRQLPASTRQPRPHRFAPPRPHPGAYSCLKCRFYDDDLSKQVG